MFRKTQKGSVMTNIVQPQDAHDPGGKVRLKLKGVFSSDAEFSPCGRYRHSLMRDWTKPGDSPRPLLWIGMNPSVADITANDPTVGREVDFTKRWGYSRYFKGNMLDWRATNPKDLPKAATGLACSADNLPALLRMAHDAEAIVLAYGKLPKGFETLVADHIAALRGANKPLWCLGKNADGSAKHPLYLKKTLTPLPF